MMCGEGADSNHCHMPLRGKVLLSPLSLPFHHCQTVAGVALRAGPVSPRVGSVGASARRVLRKGALIGFEPQLVWRGWSGPSRVPQLCIGALWGPPPPEWLLWVSKRQGGELSKLGDILIGLTKPPPDRLSCGSPFCFGSSRPRWGAWSRSLRWWRALPGTDLPC